METTVEDLNRIITFIVNNVKYIPTGNGGYEVIFPKGSLTNTLKDYIDNYQGAFSSLGITIVHSHDSYEYRYLDKPLFIIYNS